MVAIKSELEKQIKDHPNDREAVCNYAKTLEAEGKFSEALSFYIKASKLGSIEAKLKLKHLEKNKQEKQKENNKQKSHQLFSKIVASVFVLLFVLWLSYITFEFVTEHDIFASSTSEDSSAVIERAVYTKDELFFLIVFNALENFYEERGEYPASLNELIQTNPENWISFIPKEMKYKKENDSYSLSYKEVTKSPETQKRFELRFYPKTNQLALSADGDTLTLFSVASGKENLPFKSSKVVDRVVEPNGKGSSLGSRGFALEDNIAIHGTNHPNSIGERVTKGNVRLFNPDIEILYPYIAKGTPFMVLSGTPRKPMYSMGLPVLHDEKIPFENETTPNKIYKWKNE